MLENPIVSYIPILSVVNHRVVLKTSWNSLLDLSGPPGPPRPPRRPRNSCTPGLVPLRSETPQPPKPPQPHKPPGPPGHLNKINFTYLDMDLYSCHWHRLFPMYSHYWNGTHFGTALWSLLQSYKLVQKDNLYLFDIPLDKPHCLIQFHFLFHKIHQPNSGHHKSRFWYKLNWHIFLPGHIGYRLSKRVGTVLEHRTVHLDKRWSLSWCGDLNLCHCCIYLEFERSHVKDLVCRHEEYRWIRMDMYRQDRSCVIYIWRWDRRRRVWHKDRNRSLNPHLELLKPKQREQTVSLELHQRRQNHQNLDGVWFAGTLVRTEIVRITNWN